MQPGTGGSSSLSWDPGAGTCPQWGVTRTVKSVGARVGGLRSSRGSCWLTLNESLEQVWASLALLIK